LPIAEVIGDEGEQFHQRYPEVSCVPFPPSGDEHGHPVQEQPPEALVILDR